MPYKDKSVQYAYQVEWMRNRRIQWLSENGPCIDCGSWDDLEVDHVDASQKATHRVWSWSKERRDKELAKCVVRCHDCHVDKKRINDENSHGEAHYKTSLTSEQVLEIRRRHAVGERQVDLAIEFDTTKYTIYDIVSRRRWKHL